MVCVLWPRNTLLVHGIAIALAVGAPIAGAAGQRPTTAPIAIVNVNVLPMDGERVLGAQTVVVEGGTITRMGTTRSVPVPTGADIEKIRDNLRSAQ